MPTAALAKVIQFLVARMEYLEISMKRNTDEDTLSDLEEHTLTEFVKLVVHSKLVNLDHGLELLRVVDSSRIREEFKDKLSAVIHQRFRSPVAQALPGNDPLGLAAAQAVPGSDPHQLVAAQAVPGSDPHRPIAAQAVPGSDPLPAAAAQASPSSNPNGLAVVQAMPGSNPLGPSARIPEALPMGIKEKSGIKQYPVA